MIETVVLATHNREELREIFGAFSVKVLTLDDFSGMPEVEESGKTLEENALLKANAIHKFCAMPTIADDTGLEVDALGGAPGVYAARFAGENVTYADNVHLLLQKMKGVQSRDRSARFRTVMAFVDTKYQITAEGEISGIITENIRGNGGFGYDPVFFVAEVQKTFAEMTKCEKNKISHRACATKAIIQLLQAEKILPTEEMPIVH